MSREFPKPARGATSRRKRKEMERQHLHSFRCLSSDFPFGDVQENETPDFLIVTETKQKIGIKLTQVFKTSGEAKFPQQSIEATKEAITVTARTYSECLQLPPARVSLFFCLQVPLRSNRRQEIAQRVAQVVHDNMPPEGESVQLECRIGGLGGQLIAVDAIHINRVHPVVRHQWTWPESGVNAVPLFEAAIKKKTTKLDDCLQKCDECWLLIVAPSFKPSGMIHPDKESLAHNYASPFSRTYFLDFGYGRLFQLKGNCNDPRTLRTRYA
jgi:hypothetical protein